MFEKIIGNKAIKEILTKSIENDTASHSYLFVGIQGIGKKMIATEFAKNILGLENVENNNHPDFMCIEPDGNRIKIEQIRVLQKKITEKPILSNKKVYLINDADTMTTEELFIKNIRRTTRICNYYLNRKSRKCFFNYHKIKMYDTSFSTN